MNMLLLIFGALLRDNLFFGRLCGSVYGPKSVSVKDSARIGIFAIIVATLSALILSLLDRLLLMPLEAEALHLIVLAAVVFILTQIAFRVRGGKNAEGGAAWLPVFVGCMVIGIAAQIDAEILASVVRTFCTAIGYLIVLVLMAGIRERIAGSRIPACLKGLPINLITAGLMSLAFMGFIGLA